MIIGRKGLASIVLLMMAATAASAQERTTPKPAPETPAVATPAVEAPATPAAENPQAAASDTPASESTPPRSAAAPAAPKPGYVKGAKGKLVYNGPTTVVELAPTPVLDEEGKQRLDPEGKPMFNAPVRQQRDKRGNPVFDDKGTPVLQTAKDLGYDEKGKKIVAKKEKPPKMIAVNISHGTLTVDGMIGKAQLNYDIKDFKYVYMYAPWVGTVVVSNTNFPGATPQPAAFNDKTLTVTVGEHNFQLFSEKMLLSKKPETAFVLVDRNFQMPSKLPVVGYGSTIKQPYMWPGAKLVASTKDAPPIPTNLRPTSLLPPCPAGQMRKPGPPVLPGEMRDDPCVPIASVKAGATTASAAPVGATPTSPAVVPPPPPQK
jgi:hypothetical protein